MTHKVPKTAEERLAQRIGLRHGFRSRMPDDLVGTGDIGYALGRSTQRVRASLRHAGIYPVRSWGAEYLYRRADLERFAEVILSYEERFNYRRWWPGPFGQRVLIAHDPGIFRW